MVSIEKQKEALKDLTQQLLHAKNAKDTRDLAVKIEEKASEIAGEEAS